MTITNHILAGTIIGMTVSNPVVAVVLAFASHFVMDALPHFGYPGQRGYSEVLKYKLTYVVIAATLITSLLTVAVLLFTGHPFALLTGLVAASPDAFGLYNYLAFDRKSIPAHGFIKHFQVKFHRKIQRYERPWGIYIETAVTIILSVILFKLLYGIAK